MRQEELDSPQPAAGLFMTMEEKSMKVTYIDHSGFLVEMPDICFLFDYYKGKIPSIDENKPFIVFASHRHEDHYNPVIFELVKQYSDVQFILSKDIRTKWKLLEYEEQGINLINHIVTAEKNASWDMLISNGRKLRIETFKSTDEGVAFLLTYEGKTFYHAGDLNLWLWEGESGQYNNNMKASYFRELEKLKGRRIDVAFVPLDPRLLVHAGEGLESFMEYTESRHVFPMHFWGRFSVISKFVAKHPEYEDRIMMTEKAGQEFEIK